MNPSVCFLERKLKTTSKTELLQDISEICLKNEDIIFLTEIIEGHSAKDMAVERSVTITAIYRKRERLFERLHEFYLANEKK